MTTRPLLHDAKVYLVGGAVRDALLGLSPGDHDFVVVGASVQAMLDAGFNASSRFYGDARDVLGMRPKDYRAGGANAVIRFAVGETTLGPILVAQSERGVCASG